MKGFRTALVSLTVVAAGAAVSGLAMTSSTGSPPPWAIVVKGEKGPAGTPPKQPGAPQVTPTFDSAVVLKK